MILFSTAVLDSSLPCVSFVSFVSFFFVYFVYFVVLSVQGQEMSQPVVVIVGAGVTGLSAAYHLARRKHARVTVLEQGVVGDGSSTRAAGIITGLLWNRTAVEARTRSLELFRQLSRDLEGEGHLPRRRNAEYLHTRLAATRADVAAVRRAERTVRSSDCG